MKIIYYTHSRFNTDKVWYLSKSLTSLNLLSMQSFDKVMYWAKFIYSYTTVGLLWS
jgi:hypothetical protein